MLQRNEIQDLMKNPEMLAANAEAGDALKIEEVLRRAHEIHRQHGGLFGYDFEDWARAWSEVSDRRNAAKLELTDEMTAALLRGLKSEDLSHAFDSTTNGEGHRSFGAFGYERSDAATAYGPGF